MVAQIYVVDDDPVIRILMSEYLESQGYQVAVFDGAHSCINRLVTEKPDLLFIDMQMPEMNGAELLQVIRLTPDLANLPVVICSAGNDVADYTVRTFNVSADCYLSKPFQMQSLNDIICEMIKTNNEN